MAVLQGSEEVHILRNPIVQQSIWIPTRVLKEGTKPTNTDVSLQGPRTRSKWRWWVIGTSYKSAVEDEEWKQSPVFLLLRDFSGVSAYVPCPWKHTAEEWHLIQKFIQPKFSLSLKKIINAVVLW